MEYEPGHYYRVKYALVCAQQSFRNDDIPQQVADDIHGFAVMKARQ